MKQSTRPKERVIKLRSLILYGGLFVLFLVSFMFMRLASHASQRAGEEDFFFKLRDSVVRSLHIPRIPHQLILTAKKGRMEDLPKFVQMNLKRNLELSPKIKLVLMGDAECQTYIRRYFDEEMSGFFEAENRGSFRGDICRSCVLANEGGFYLDLDVQLKSPLLSLVNENTTFMSVISEDRSLLNAFLASEPRSPVMLQAVEEIRKWYRGEVPRRDLYSTSEWMGPLTMLRAVRNVTTRLCGVAALRPQADVLQWKCGSQEIRLYEEQELNCFGGKTKVENPECPPSRLYSSFAGVRFGIFEPVKRRDRTRTIVAWPRFAECSEWGCSAGGWEESVAATALPSVATTTKFNPPKKLGKRASDAAGLPMKAPPRPQKHGLKLKANQKPVPKMRPSSQKTNFEPKPGHGGHGRGLGHGHGHHSPGFSPGRADA
mmetsp:Transcript_1550/g.3394  ORF Transcript_1550/g.3394 Transcript_1550/m.3394 type:complete len:431 (-) Transcript_1550:758-2050(-)